MKRVASLFLAICMLAVSSAVSLAYEREDGYEEIGENIMIVPVDETSSEPEPFDILERRAKGVVSSDSYDNFSLTWTSDGSRDILQEISKPSLDINYEYNESGYRTSKTVNNIVTEFTYGTVRGIANTLISENRNGLVINYTFDIDPVGSTARCIPSGFEIAGTNYRFVFDDSDIISGISDENGTQIIKYEYVDGIVSSICELDENGNWKDASNDPQSIGNINRIRYLGNYFDEETGWYYSDSYYDPSAGRFIDGIQTSPNSIETDIDALYDQCINDPSFGQGMAAISGWYSSLSTVEIVARLVYGENTYDESNGFDRYNERKAEGWVLFNRVGAPGITGNSSLRDVCTASDQFATISGKGSYDARNPVRSKEAWREAVYIACCLVETSNRSSLNTFIPRPTGISEQLFFYGLSQFSNEFTTTSSGLRHNGHDLEDVTIVDIAFNITASSIITGTDNKSTHNIFYNWAS